MPSSRALRAAPARVFENYILTKEIGLNSGLSKHDFRNFSNFDNFVSSPWVDGDITSVLSSEFDIGFPFMFGGITYTKFVASTNGWIALSDPASPFAYTQVLDGSDLGSNYNIKSTISTNAVLIAPWFDDLRNLSNSLIPGITQAPYPITNPVFTSLFEQGVNQPPINFDPIDYGCRYYRTDKTPYGRCLIVRWNSTSYFSFDSKSRFEVLLYENGRIEFRYDKRLPQIQADTTKATIGIFMPGTNRFRDFSYGLGYRDKDRNQYVYGGAVYDSSYTDTEVATKPYSVNLKVTQHWPGLSRFGATLVFQPPLNRRKILPRQALRDRDSKITLPTVARTGDERAGNQISLFDDRNSIAYKQGIVNYPTTLPRFFGNSSEGVSDRQDLFSNDFLVTGSVVNSLVQDYIGNKKQQQISPFSEVKRFEQDKNNSSFFSVGSSVADVGVGFAQPLSAKTQIRLSFRIDHKTTLYPASSSIYYYNSNTKRWQYPTSSFSSGFDIANPYTDVINQRLIEVDRGFNAVGFNICSGSSNRSIGNFGTDDLMNSRWTRQNEVESLLKPLEKSIFSNVEYSANSDESFVIPISQPFLLEKAVIELPIEAGPGWFNDKTRCFMPIYDTGSSYGPAARSLPFDVGGPGVTVALYNQVQVNSNKTRRDLILSGVITHENDSSNPSIVYGAAPDVGTSPGRYVYQINPVGFLAYGGTPAAIVNGSSSFFTGTVQLNCEAAVSNGVLVRDTIYVTHNYSVDFATASLERIFNTAQWGLSGRGSIENFNSDPNGNGFRERTIVGINNFGRGGSGFQPSGRSIFGKEYTTSQGINKDYYDNPFYLYKDANILNALVDLATASFSNPSYAGFYATSLINQQVSKVSPYLLFPNDRLVLSVSKARPFFFSTDAARPYTSGSIQHDIKLSTGSINITLYGSLVANGAEYHDTLNQPLASEAVHEVVIGETKTW
jgi:hypothetical protein